MADVEPQQSELNEEGFFLDSLEPDDLQKSGAIDKVQKMISSEEEVWIKRTSGKWQKAKLDKFGPDRTVVAVWPHDNKP